MSVLAHSCHSFPHWSFKRIWYLIKITPLTWRVWVLLLVFWIMYVDIITRSCMFTTSGWLWGLSTANPFYFKTSWVTLSSTHFSISAVKYVTLSNCCLHGLSVADHVQICLSAIVVRFKTSHMLVTKLITVMLDSCMQLLVSFYLVLSMFCEQFLCNL